MSIKANLEGDWIRLRFPFDRNIIEQLKEIPGRQFDGTTKTWLIPSPQWRTFIQWFGRQDIKIEVPPEQKTDLSQLEKFSFSPIHEVGGMRGKLYPFQEIGVGWLVARRRGLLADDMGCITGDGLISLDRNGKGFKITMKNLYFRFNGLDPRYKWTRSPTFVRVLRNGFFHLEEIEAVIYSGKKKVYAIADERHQSLKATDDHLFSTPEGWRPLSALHKGDELVTNGEAICVTNGEAICICCGKPSTNIITYAYAKFRGFCRKCMLISRRKGRLKSGEYLDSDGYVIVSGMQNHPHARRQGMLKHRLVFEAYLNHETYEQWLNRGRKGEWKEASLFLSDTDLIHHRNGDKQDNSLPNLMLTSPDKHMLEHAEGLEHRMPIFRPKISKIREIIFHGVEDVYDIRTKGPAHNFIANDFVVHNCGKTIEALAAAIELRDRGLITKALVFAPKTVVPQWASEMEAFFKERAATIVGSKAEREMGYIDAEASFLAITNYETVLRDHSRLLELSPDLVILDEAQRIGSYEAQTTRKICAHFRPPYRWALTGTPLENSLAELHSIFDWIDPGILGPWYLFKETYIIYGGFKGKQIVGSRNLRMLREQIQDWMLRRVKEEVLPDLPPVTVNNYYVALDGEERAIYKKIQKELLESYRWWSKTGLDSGEILAKLTYLRECCDHPSLIEGRLDEHYDGGGSKLSELLNILRDLGDRKVVVFSEFERMHQLIAPYLKNHARLHGKMSVDERVDNLTRFREDPACNVLLSTDAGGLGLNLQFASTIINYECHWNPGRFRQRVDRLRRIGQRHDTVTCINLIARDTIEERVLLVIRDKTNLFRKVIDGQFDGLDEGSMMWQLLEAEFATQKKLF